VKPQILAAWGVADQPPVGARPPPATTEIFQTEFSILGGAAQVVQVDPSDGRSQLNLETGSLTQRTSVSIGRIAVLGERQP
jgi:hypothetical protein